jgi:malonate transporter
MGQAFSVILPVIAVIFVGFAAAYRGVLSADNVVTLNRFVFVISAPALLFRNVALTEFPPTLPWGLWVSYYGAMVSIMALAFIFASLVLPRWPASARVIFAFGSCFSNTVMLGIPIILTAFGPGAGLPLFLVLAFHGLLVFTIALTCLEVTTKDNLRLGEVFVLLARAMRDQMVIVGLLAGVIWNFTGLGLAAPVDRFLDLLGSAAIPVALIAVGGRLAYISWREDKGVALGGAVLTSGFKLVVMPMLVFALAHYVFALPPLFTATITLLSAMPTGVFTAVFATQYQTAEDTASSAIVVSTLLGALSIALWLSFFAELLVV